MRFLLLLLLLVVLVPVFLVRAGIYVRWLQSQHQAAVDANRELARAAATAFEAYVDDVAHQEQAIGMGLAFLEPPTSPQASEFLTANAAQYPPVIRFHWVSPQGRVINCSDPHYIGLDISSREHFQKAIRSNDWVLADLSSSIVDGAPVFMLDRPIRDKAGVLQGVVAAILDPHRLEPQILNIGRAPGGRVMILDRQRRIVCIDPDVDLAWDKRVVARNDLIDQALAGAEATGVVQASLDGQRRAVALVPIGRLGWVAVASRPVSSIMAPLREDMLLTGLATAIVVAGSVLLALLISRQISRGVKGLEEHAAALAGGHLDHRAGITGIAELQAVAEAFNRMAASRQQAERALQESEVRLLTLIESLPFDVWACDPDGRYTLINSAAREHWGDQVGRKPEEIGAPPEVAALWASNNRRALAGELVRGEAVYLIEGQERTYFNILSPIRDGERLYGIVGVNIDITDRKRAEQTLRESEEKFRSLAENSQAIIGTIQGQHFIYANPYLSRISGYSREQLLSLDLARLIHPSFRATILDRLQRRQRGEDAPANYEFIMLTKDGQERWLDISPVRIIYKGEPAVIGIAYDVTDRKRAEQQLRDLNETLEQRVSERTAVAEQRAAQLRAMAAELSQAEERERRRLAHMLHDDLQQLLAASKFHAAALQGRLGTDALRLRMAQVVDLLDQSIRTSRSLTIELSPPILYDAGLPTALDWLARWMQSKHGLHVEVQADEAANPRAEEIKVFLFQAARELLFNVAKHAKSNRAIVQLARTDDGQVRLIVSDTGAGFVPDAPPGGERSRSGFGLFSIRERLELLGGRMEIESAPESGTRITLFAPAQSPAEAATPPVTPNASSE